MKTEMYLQGCFMFFLMSALMLTFSLPVQGQTTRFLVGTTKGEVEESIAVCDLDEAKETLTVVAKLKGGQRPGYLALNGDNLYAVSTDSQGEDQHTLRAFSLSDQGTALKMLSEVSSMGVNPCHIAVDPKGASLYTANYSRGGIAQYALETDGAIGEHLYDETFTGKSVNPDRQQEPHAHYINTTRDNKFVLTADLGTDKVMVHQVGSKGKIAPYSKQPYFELPPGSGPRHLEFHPNNRWIYVLNELKSTITKVTYEKGKFTVEETISTLPEDFKEVSYSAAVRIHPSGNFIYSSDRGSDSISVFAIDKNGNLTRIQTFGDGLGWVRDFNVTPSGNFIVAGNERTDQVALLKLDDGRIAKHITSIELPAPSCFVFLD